MSDLFALWLPILVSAVIVFVASSIVWMVLPHHKPDIRPLPDEPAFAEVLRSMNLKPGVYMWPNTDDPQEMRSEAFKERYRTGPWGTITIQGSAPNFARNLALVFLFYLVVSTFTAYITELSRPAGSPYLSVFQVAGAVALLGYCAGSIPSSVFFGKPLRFVFTEFLDGLVYALLTAGTFAWLWPE